MTLFAIGIGPTKLTFNVGAKSDGTIRSRPCLSDGQLQQQQQ